MLKARPATIAIVIGGGLVALGSLLPWVRITSGLGSLEKAGTTGDGSITLVLGIVVVILGVVRLSQAGRGVAIAALLCASAAAAVAIYDGSNIANLAAESTSSFVQAEVGEGLVLVGIGGVIAAIAALVAMMGSTDEPTMSTRQCPYCAEAIQWSAVVCRWCGRDLENATAPAQVTSRIPEYSGPIDIEDLVADARSLVDQGLPTAQAVERLHSITNGDRAPIQAAARMVSKAINRSLTAGDKGKTFKLLVAASKKR